MSIEPSLSVSFPLKDKNDEPPVYERKNTKYMDLGSKFSSTSKDYAKQFFHIYSQRLKELRPIVIKRAEIKWAGIKIVKLPDLETLENEVCIITGTLFKQQLWKPSILRELNEETQESSIIVEKHDNYGSEKDQAFMEDEMLRVKIVGANVNLEEVVTGVVCALKGKKLDNGSFEVEDWCFPGCPLQKSLSPPAEGKILLISGLDLASKPNTMALDLLIEWLTGLAGTTSSQQAVVSVTNLLIAGNSVKCGGDQVQHSKGLMGARLQETAMAKEISTATQKLDELLTEIVSHCSVILMPGQFDPTNLMLPQKPIQPFMLKHAHKYDNLKGVTNPWIGTMGNRLISGSSGQPIEDILRVSGGNDVSPLQWLERTLDFRHYCPTAPDTLPAYPFDDKDLFIIQDCPDVYFVGNTEKYATKLWKGENGQTVRLICIPKFSTTSIGVLVNLQNLDVEPIYFGASEP